MPPTLDTVLSELGFTGTELDQAKALLGPRADKVQKLFMAQSDYSRSKDELAKLEAKIKAQETQLADEFANVAKWESSLKTALNVNDPEQVPTRLNQMITELATNKDRAEKLEAELRKHATDYGFTPSIPTGTPAGNGGGAPPPRTDIDTSRFVRQEDLADYPLLPAAIADLQTKHMKLFGTPLENMSELVQASIASAKEAAKYRDPSRQKSVEQVWMEKHNVEARRVEVANQAKEAEFAKRLDEEKIKWASQQGASGTPSSGLPGSPVVGKQFKPVITENKIPQPGNENRGVTAALQNFGQYYQNT